jgi:hypothetical protein
MKNSRKLLTSGKRTSRKILYPFGVAASTNEYL